MTTLYLIRHSVKFPRKEIDYYNGRLDDTIIDEKAILSVIGEKRAEILASKDEFKNVDVIYSSDMVRCMQTAKYLCNNLNLRLNIDKRLNERNIGKRTNVNYEHWYTNQYLNKDFKIESGESQREVSKRMHECLKEILKKHKNKTIAVFSHGYAITFSLLKWCKLVNVTDDRLLVLEFNNKIIYNQVLNAPEVFKLTFDKNKIKNIELVKFNDLEYMTAGI